jgi:hypothetical protein
LLMGGTRRLDHDRSLALDQPISSAAEQQPRTNVGCFNHAVKP